MPFINLIVTEPSVYVPVRTQSYRILVEAEIDESSSSSSSEELAIEGRFGELDENIFVVQDTDYGVTDFLRVVEPRDLALPLTGSLRRVSALDIYVTSKITSEEFLVALIDDVYELMSAHLEGTVRVHRLG